MILLHQVCDASEYQKWTAHQKMIVAENILLCTFLQHRSVHVLCSDVCYIVEIILQRPRASTSALYRAWLAKVLSGLLEDCLSVCPGSACCLCCPLILAKDSFFLSPQSLVTTEIPITELFVKLAKLTVGSLSVNMD